MPDFMAIIGFVLFNEGVRSNSLGWVNDPHDLGRETIAGISRFYNPYWEGWKVVDSYDKKEAGFQSKMAADPKLSSMITNFYQTKYWLVNHLDAIPDSYLAYITMDGVVIGGGIFFLQQATNAVGKMVIKQDNDFGPTSQGALLSLLPVHREDLAKSALDFREAFHRHQAATVPGQETNLAGWLNRVELLRSQKGNFK